MTARTPDINNEVLTVVWSTVTATGEATLRVTWGDKVGAWSIGYAGDGDFWYQSTDGSASFYACNRLEAIGTAVRMLGGEL